MELEERTRKCCHHFWNMIVTHLARVVCQCRTELVVILFEVGLIRVVEVTELGREASDFENRSFSLVIVYLNQPC